MERTLVRFNELHESIPLVRYGKEKSLSANPYPNIKLLFPGRHAEDTSPKGGDFCVAVTDKGMKWRNHQFTHTDIFADVEVKADMNPEHMGFFMNQYLNVIAAGDDPTKINLGDGLSMSGIDFNTFLYAAQCLAVAEHRRYHMHEPKFGGRFLPFRFAAGIAEGLWTATDAVDKQKRGRIGVEWLEKDHGLPTLTKQLMGK
jgi:hypothetical protein